MPKTKTEPLKPRYHSRSNLPPRTRTTFKGESMTQQHFKDSQDINNIVGRYVDTGVLSTQNQSGIGTARQPFHGDLTDGKT